MHFVKLESDDDDAGVRTFEPDAVEQQQQGKIQCHDLLLAVPTCHQQATVVSVGHDK